MIAMIIIQNDNKEKVALFIIIKQWNKHTIAQS